MLEVLFFILGLVNSVFLIFIFLIRKNRLDLLQRIGWVYLLLAIPAVYGIMRWAQFLGQDRGDIKIGSRYLQGVWW